MAAIKSLALLSSFILHPSRQQPRDGKAFDLAWDFNPRAATPKA
jgi:hypothetical protein